jgi:xanthine dehydrogenase molybdopterin-binding subunit B
MGHQYHFHLETQRAICIPGEDNSMDVYSSTQNPTQVKIIAITCIKTHDYKPKSLNCNFSA